MKISYADLFCGCGGLSFHFQRNKSFAPVTAIDNWESAIEAYNSNFSSKVGIVRDLSAPLEVEKTIEELKGKLDLLVGGPPCQGFSTLGKRATDCEKSVLVDTFLEIALGVSPEIFVMENVRGLLSKKHPNGGTYPEQIEKIIGSTYNSTFLLFNTIEYSLPQTRQRYLLIGTKKTTDRKGELLQLIVKNIEKQKSKIRKTLRDAIGDLPKLEPGIGADELKTGSRKTIYNHKALRHSEELKTRFNHVPPGGGLLDVPEELLTPHLRKMKNGSYGSGGHVKNIYGRMHWEKPSGTIVAGIDKITCGRYVHPEEDRLITPRECARIQSFPDWFKFKGSNVTQYYLIGNAVPPKLSQVLAKSILATLKETSS